MTANKDKRADLHLMGKAELVQKLEALRKQVRDLSAPSDAGHLPKTDTLCRRTEAALRDSEARFKGLFEVGLVGIAVLLPNGTFQQVNKAYCSFVGYDGADLIGQHFSKVIHPDDLEVVTERLRQLLDGEFETYQHELRYRHREGHEIWGLASLDIQRDSEGQAQSFVVQVLDISERRRADEALRERETLLRQAADMATLGHWVWDEVEDRCIYCSETLARMNGVSVAEYLSRYATMDGLLEEVHPEDRKKYQRCIEAAAADKRSYSVEFRELKAGGSIRYLREKGEPVLDTKGRLVRTVGTLQDITEHRETEQALKAARDDLEQRVVARTAELQKNQAHLKAIMDHSPVQVGLKDTEGRYVLVNREFERRYGVKNEEIAGKFPEDIFPPEAAAQVREHDQDVLKSNQAIERIVRGEIDGEMLSFLAVKFPVRDGDGNVIGVGAAATDITERERAEQALRERDARLREQQGQLDRFSRVSAMGQLSRTLAYDLSQPVTAMMNYCAAVRRLVQAESRPDTKRIVEIMDRTIGEAARIADDIRHMRKLFETADRTTSPQDINQIVEDAFALALIDPAQAGALCKFDRGDDLPNVDVNRLEIQQVAFNLIKNALEAFAKPDTGEVRITTALNESGMIEVLVTDSGQGIAAEIEEQMFQPFVTTKPNNLGLGLSISRSIIAAYAGSLCVEANPGGGTRASFTLPAIR